MLQVGNSAVRRRVERGTDERGLGRWTIPRPSSGSRCAGEPTESAVGRLPKGVSLWVGRHRR